MGLLAPTQRARGTTLGSSGARAPVLLFRVGEGTYGIDASKLWEVLLPDGVTDLPTAAEQAVSGLAYRGRRLPLVRLGELFGSSADRLPSGARVLLTHGRGSPLGLLVDEVLGMAEVDVSRVVALPALATLLSPRFFRGLFTHEGHPVLLLSPEGLGEVEQIAQFSSES